MFDSTIITTLTALLLAGLAGSLHCIGMCGPILIGFSQAFSHSGNGTPIRRSLALDFAFYHAGRIWTYAMLGLLAGFVGQGIRDGSAWAGWQQPAAFALSVLTVIVGLALTGWMPGLDLSKHFNGCAFKQFGGAGWYKSLLRGPGIVPRLLLGAIMGLLPCGLVYAALLMAAALPTPWHAAGGMIIFGVGTLPSLSAVLIASRAVPVRWRAHGTRLAAVFVIAAGGWMAYRAAITPESGCACGHGDHAQTEPDIPQPQSGTPR